MSLIEAKNICKSFNMGKVNMDILKDISLQVEGGEFVTIIGESGSGKSTLLNVLGGLMPCNTGEILICGERIDKLNQNQLALFRRKHMGFVFQAYNLMPQLTALENVELPLMFAGVEKKKRRKIAMDMLERVGLKDRVLHRPGELSGGQQQRVSIARALVNSPKVILADEPTGNLDSKNSVEVMEVLRELNKKSSITFLVVTHSQQVCTYADRSIKVVDGLILN
ncbi:ABC transporter ATP-binding protein [Clostridium omnivorum]|uniref:Peptide ABC transporter ATP-binding protein n=1 Tax=Clostridium omnivorum TaxID=1604902 RepID=A0ABQ5N2F2_9CLOT|nr:ABC transporter ATP-binding protein [Clostridium sp. E14]GLC29383.1 peptide ABC transporter ATP-binding protein [Clostridium sp. E14]